jgi:hypothetical protein
VLSALKAHVETIHFVHSHREPARKIIANYLRLSDSEVIDATYTAFVKTVAKKPYPTLKDIQFLPDEVAAKLPNAKSGRPGQFADLSLAAIGKRGFLAAMAKRYP